MEQKKEWKPIQQEFLAISERAERIMQCFLQSADDEVKEWTPVHIVSQSFMYAALFEQQKDIQEEQYWDKGSIVGVDLIV